MFRWYEIIIYELYDIWCIFGIFLVLTAKMGYRKKNVKLPNLSISHLKY